MRAKGKLRKNMGRFGRMHLTNKETTNLEPPDLSHLRKPIDTNLCSLKQVARLFETGSNEVKAILTYECDVVYECRICRSLFRSLANFISHKRVYCSEKYDVTQNKNGSMDPMNPSSNRTPCANTETMTESDCRENFTNDRILRSTNTTRKEPKHDLTSIVDMLQKKHNKDNLSDESTSNAAYPLRICSDIGSPILLEIMTSNQAAYQTVLQTEMSTSGNMDLMKNQTRELNDMLNRNTAILGPNGELLGVDNISGAENQHGNEKETRMNLNPAASADLTCSACKASFATKKTLTFHVKSKHMAHLMNWPCPCCTSIFTNRASVHRHLIKVHRKTTEQMRRLRSQIQPLKMLNAETATTNSSELNREVESIRESQNLLLAQEWMQNLVLNAEHQRCGACGKRFDRKAALASHSLICAKRMPNGRSESKGRRKRASKNRPQRVTEIIKPIAERPINDELDNERCDENIGRTSPKIEIQDWQMPEEAPSMSISRVSEESPETSIRVKDVSSLSKDVWDKIGTDHNSGNSEPESEKNNSPATHQKSPRSPKTPSKTKLPESPKNPSDFPEVIYTTIDNSRPVTLSKLNTEKKLAIQYRGIRLPTVTLEKINVPRGRIDSNSIEPNISLGVSSERSNQIDKKLSTLANLRKLQCLPCNRKFMSLINLRRHIAVHLKRRRYRCKLCDFRSFLKCDCIAHCNKKHDAKNNRTILAELVIEVPINNESAESNKTSKNKEPEVREEPEVIDVIEASTSAREKTPLENKEDERNKESSSDTEKTASTEMLAERVLAMSKPKRGRPPKRTRKKRSKKRKFEQAKPVSPPTLAEEFSDDDEISNTNDSQDSQDSPNEKSPSRFSKLSRRRAPSRMDCDPELRKMVMEVIFGNTETPSEEVTDKASEVQATDEIDIVCERVLDNGDVQELSEIGPKNNGESRAMNVSDKNNEIDIQISSVDDSNSNFHYDVKTLSFPKDVVILGSPIVETDALSGRSLVQLQTQDSQCDSGFSGSELLSSASSFSTDGGLIIYEDRVINTKLTEIQQTDIVFCADK